MGNYQNLSLSFSKENSIYLDMLKALSAYYESIGVPKKESSISNIILKLIKTSISEKVQEILNDTGIDIMNEFREFQRRRLTAVDFFETNRIKRSAIGRLIDKKLEE